MASTSRRTLSSILAGCVLATPIAPAATAADKLRVLIIDGQNNHDWRAMTPPMKADLERSGRFTVDVVTTPAGQGRRNRPGTPFGPTSPSTTWCSATTTASRGRRRFKRPSRTTSPRGAAWSIIHAANNSFPDWPAYNKMIGLGWRIPSFGDRLTVDDAGKVVRTPKGEGPGLGHGPQHAFKIVVRDADHPITRGMPAEWMHAKDELYHGQRGPGPGHANPRHGLFRQGQGRHRHERADDLGHSLRQGPRLTTRDGPRHGHDTTAIRCVGFTHA